MSEGTNSVRVRILDTNQVDDFIRLVKIFEKVLRWEIIPNQQKKRKYDISIICLTKRLKIKFVAAKFINHTRAQVMDQKFMFAE